jgi:hypothetical protein
MRGDRVSTGLIILLSLLCGCGSGSSGSNGTSVSNGSTPSSSVSLFLFVTPNPAIVYPNSTIVLKVAATVINSSATPTVTIPQLPAGISSSTSFPLTVPPGGANILLQGAPSLSAGGYNITLNGQVASVTATTTISVAAQTTAPAFFFDQPLFSEVGVPIGGSSQIVIQSGGNGPGLIDYSVNLAASGLPPGTTAAISPNPMTPGQTVTVTITASSGAPISQNVPVALVGTPAAAVPQAGRTFLVDVTQPPGSRPNSRTDYVGLEGTPLWAAYDSAHGLIFTVNGTWNRVEVISALTHTFVKVIPIRDPRWVDVSPDNTTA